MRRRRRRSPRADPAGVKQQECGAGPERAARRGFALRARGLGLSARPTPARYRREVRVSQTRPADRPRLMPTSLACGFMASPGAAARFRCQSQQARSQARSSSWGAPKVSPRSHHVTPDASQRHHGGPSGAPMSLRVAGLVVRRRRSAIPIDLDSRGRIGRDWMRLTTGEITCRRPAKPAREPTWPRRANCVPGLVGWVMGRRGGAERGVGAGGGGPGGWAWWGGWRGGGGGRCRGERVPGEAAEAGGAKHRH
jgi:hypothetical protein